MLKSWISAIACTFVLTSFTPIASANDLPDFTVLAEKHGAEVVNISVSQVMQAGNGTPFSGMPPEIQEQFRKFGIPIPDQSAQGEPEQKRFGLGSGFIISADGYILTNAHVVDGADEVLVKLTDKREFKAKIIGSDKRTDVALIKIEATNLPKATIGDPALLKVGEWVAAMGSPLGFENTMTAGIVSAKGRALPQENYVPFIQTDVAINPGNSGGPLYNLRGEVVGINSRISGNTGSYIGISFSIPIDVAIDISNQLKASGKITRGWLGVGIQELTKELAESFGMKNTNGALIAGVEKNSPAEKGGMLAGDVITKFDGKTITVSSDLPRAVGASKPGRTVPAEVLRKGSVKTLNINVGEAPADPAETVPVTKPAPKVEANKIGLTLKELTPTQKKKLNGKNGLLVAESAGAAAQAGIRRGDVILGLNNNETQSVEAFNKQINAVTAGKTVAVLVLRGESTLYVPIKVAK
jgi:serine protease Do